MSDLNFTDDLASFYEFRTLTSVQQFIESVSATLAAHSFQVNVDKLEVCAVVTGPGSRSLAKHLRRGHLAVHPRDGHGTPCEFIFRESAEYLGSILRVSASCCAELRNRTSQADEVHGRPTPRVRRRSSITMALMVRLWKSLVLSKCFCALKARGLSRADLLFMESASFASFDNGHAAQYT